MNNLITDNRCSLWDLNIREITLSNNHYRLLNSPKRGASCLVYEALRIERVGAKTFEHKIILKEFFPIPATEESEKITRNTDGSLFLPEKTKNSPEYQNLLQRFFDSYEILLELSKTEDGIEHAVAVHALMEANGTWYIEEVYDAGVLLFDYFKKYDLFPSIRQFLNFLGYSMEIVGNLHNLGYYHLDLKPNNLSFTRSGIVRFFDTDSFVKISELGTDTSFPQSGGFSAPELSQAARRPYDAPYLIGPWTDIYSLAQFICYYLFGRTVQYFELIELLPTMEEHILYTDYYTDYQWFEKYSDIEKLQDKTSSCKPLIPRNGVFLLKQFLLKALNPRLANRYRTAQEAQKALEEICNCFYNYQFQLIDSFQEFIPAEFEDEDELEKLTDFFFEQTSPEASNVPSKLDVLTCTDRKRLEEFAKYYATLHREDYDSIHEICGNDLEAALKNLLFFQHSNTSVLDALKLAIQDRTRPTLLIFYEENMDNRLKTRYHYFISLIMRTIPQNLHILYASTNRHRFISGLNWSKLCHISYTNLFVPGKPMPFDGLWKYDWFWNLYSGLLLPIVVFWRCFGRYIVGLCLIIFIVLLIVYST